MLFGFAGLTATVVSASLSATRLMSMFGPTTSDDAGGLAAKAACAAISVVARTSRVTERATRDRYIGKRSLLHAASAAPANGRTDAGSAEMAGQPSVLTLGTGLAPRATPSISDAARSVPDCKRIRRDIVARRS